MGIKLNGVLMSIAVRHTFTNNSQGVMILLNDKVEGVQTDQNGNCMDITIQGKRLTLVNL